jgi:hypothetical protein
VSDLDKDRVTRLIDARSHLPLTLWVALVGLAVCMLLFSWLLGIEDIRLHMFRVSVLMAGIALVFCTIFVLSRPYGTVLRIQPQPFEVLLDKFEGNGKGSTSYRRCLPLRFLCPKQATQRRYTHRRWTGAMQTS